MGDVGAGCEEGGVRGSEAEGEDSCGFGLLGGLFMVWEGRVRTGKLLCALVDFRGDEILRYHVVFETLC